MNYKLSRTSQLTGSRDVAHTPLSHRFFFLSFLFNWFDVVLHRQRRSDGSLRFRVHRWDVPFQRTTLSIYAFLFVLFSPFKTHVFSSVRDKSLLRSEQTTAEGAVVMSGTVRIRYVFAGPKTAEAVADFLDSDSETMEIINSLIN